MTERVSSAELMARFAALEALQAFRLNPEPLLVYKPNDRDFTKGTALRLQVRTKSGVSESGSGTLFRELDRKASGLFVDLAPQTSVDEAGNARFGWEQELRITAKLGLPDVQTLLLGYREVRLKGKPVPESARPKVKQGQAYVTEPTGAVVGSVHKFGDAVTILDWTFSEKGSAFRVARVKTRQSRSIFLSLPEELGFVRYLENALDIMLEVGLR